VTKRQHSRVPVKIPAGYRTDDGAEFETSVIDISASGCRLRDGIEGLRPGSGLSISIGNMAPVSAQVRWQYRSTCGISFTRPLHGAIVDHLQAVHARGVLRKADLL